MRLQDLVMVGTPVRGGASRAVRSQAEPANERGIQFSLAGPQLTLSPKPKLRCTAGEAMTKPRLSLTAVASFTAFFLATCLLASDWPQWRGPERNGISKETGLLNAWPKDGPKLFWQVNDIGYGYLTPAVVGERLYLVSNKGLDDEFVQALEVKSGKQIWAQRIG